MVDFFGEDFVAFGTAIDLVGIFVEVAIASDRFFFVILANAGHGPLYGGIHLICIDSRFLGNDIDSWLIDISNRLEVNIGKTKSQDLAVGFGG